MATYPILEHARIVSRDPNVKVQVRHQKDCPAAADAERHCRCEPTVTIVRPSRKAGAR